MTTQDELNWDVLGVARDMDESDVAEWLAAIDADLRKPQKDREYMVRLRLAVKLAIDTIASRDRIRWQEFGF